MGTAVSRATIRRTLNKQGLHGRTPRKKPLLKESHKKARLDFAKKHVRKPLSYWESVLWTDETKLLKFGPTGQRYIWRRKNQADLAKNVLPTVKHGGGSLMFWGCFSAEGTGELYRIKGRMNSIVYQDILQQTVMPSVQKLRLGRQNWIFQQDNDPKHTSKATRKWFGEKSWRVMEWPAYSPDLNPIENLWWDLKKAVARQNPKNLRDLEAIAIDEWAKIPAARCRKLVTDYASRLKAVITAKGGHTKY